MKYLKKFEEVRFSDVLKIKGESDLSDKIKHEINKDFDDSKELIDSIILKNEFLLRKIKLRIQWNNTNNHNLIERIKERTNFKSIEEFNRYFEEKINKIIPKEIGKQINEKGRYSLYDKELNFSIIVDINPQEFIRKNIFKIFVFTIIPLRRQENVIKVLDI
jgi:hypothetical protein